MWPMSLKRYSTAIGNSLDMDSVTWGQERGIYNMLNAAF